MHEHGCIPGAELLAPTDCEYKFAAAGLTTRSSRILVDVLTTRSAGNIASRQPKTTCMLGMHPSANMSSHA